MNNSALDLDELVDQAMRMQPTIARRRCKRCGCTLSVWNRSGKGLCAPCVQIVATGAANLKSDLCACGRIKYGKSCTVCVAAKKAMGASA